MLGTESATETERPKQASRNLTAQLFVSNLQEAYREKQSADEDIKELCAGAREAGFSANDVAAAKAVAQLSVRGTIDKARAKFEALERVSHAVGVDLFSFADSRQK